MALIKEMMRFFRTHAEFMRQLATMMSGRAIAVVIGLVITPIVARLFLPSDFGVAATFIAIVAIASQVASLRYEAAIPLPRQATEARALVSLSYWLLSLFCVVCFVAIALYKLSGLRFGGIDNLGKWIWAIPLGVFLLGARDIQESWLSRLRAFGAISSSVVLETLLGGVLRIAFGVFKGTSVYGLVISYLVGTLGRVVLQRLASVRTVDLEIAAVSLLSLRRAAREYGDFPKLNAPAGLVFAGTQNLPVIFLGAMFSPAVAGLYAMANRLAQIPIQVVANSIRRVYLQKAAAIHNDGRSLWRSFLISTSGLALLGLGPFVSVLLFGQELFAWLLGERWAIAGHYLEIMSPWMFMVWVSAPCNAIFVVLRRQKQWLNLQLTLALVRLGAFGIASVVAFGPEDTVRAFAWANVVASLGTIVLAFLLISKARAR